MTFEKALEAMKQGKKVRMASFVNEYWFYDSALERIIIYVDGNCRDFGLKLIYDIIESNKNDWGIYEEPQKEPEMTAEKKCECKCKENSEKWIEKAVDNQRIEEEFKDALACIREQPRKLKPEKCTCNCGNHISDLQEEMKQALSRKFYELAENTSDAYSVNIMLDIYRLLYDGDENENQT